MSYIGAQEFPAQKKLERQKTEDWAKQCIRAACDMGIYNDSYYNDYKEARTNVDMYNNILNVDDMMNMCDPFNLIDENDFPFKPQHYPIANSKINVLVGEEVKRRFDWSVNVINPGAISQKEKEKAEKVKKELTALIAEDVPPEQAARRLQELDSYLKFEYQDMRETNATHLLRHMMEKENMTFKWNNGFRDGLNAGAEIYSLDIVGGDPRVRKCNPLQVQSIRRGQSPDITDSDIIIEWGYYSRGRIIDDFHEYLKSDEISKIESMGMTSGTSDREAVAVNREPHLLAGSIDLIEDENGELIPADNVEQNAPLLAFNADDGSVLVTRVVWRSYRKIQKVKYYDDKTGEQLYKFVDEYYKPRAARGEEVESTIWVTDWWEGTRIGEDIFVKMRPFPVKAYSMMNPTGTLCPYVGGYYTVDGEPTTSLMGRMKPYSYYYDFIMYKQWETLSKHKGVIGYLDLAMIPEGWETEDALYFAEKMGWMPIDSFKEGNKGQATGKLAGGMNNNRNPMDFNMSNYLQQNMLMLNFLKDEMSHISGVTPQREGAISSQELVGNTERAVVQSSHITEMYFHFHDRIKVATLKAMLELAKHAYRDRKVEIQYIADDMSKIMMEVDGNSFREIDYGIAVTSSYEYQKLYESIKQVAQLGVQSEKINLKQIMDILSDPSISSMRRKIESAEYAKVEQEAETLQRQQEAAREIEQMKQQGARELEVFKAEIAARMENLKTDGQMDIEKLKGEIQRLLKLTPDAPTLDKNQVEIEKLNMEHEHESKENRLDRMSQEKIASKRTSSASKSS